MTYDIVGGKNPDGYCGVPRAGEPPTMLWRTRVLVTRSEATMERWMGAARTTRRSRAERAGGGPGPTGEGPEQEDRGPTASIRSAGGALTYRMTAETLRVRALHV